MFRPSLALFLFTVLSVMTLRAEPVPNVSRWEKNIQGYVAGDAVNPPKQNGVLFIGSSSIRLWKTLESDFPNHDVINRGFGGSKIKDSVEFADRIAIPYKPRLIIFYAGSNDIASGDTPERVFSDYRAFVQKIHAALPETQIAFLSIVPAPAREKKAAEIAKANKLIEEFSKSTPNCHYIDAATPLFDADGAPKMDCFAKDRLHLSPAGYVLWRETVAPWLDKLASVDQQS